MMTKEMHKEELKISKVCEQYFTDDGDCVKEDYYYVLEQQIGASGDWYIIEQAETLEELLGGR